MYILLGRWNKTPKVGELVTGYDKNVLPDSRTSEPSSVARTQIWSFTTCQHLVMLDSDDYLKLRCAVAKEGCKNIPMNTEEPGILEGKVTTNL